MMTGGAPNLGALHVYIYISIHKLAIYSNFGLVHKFDYTLPSMKYHPRIHQPFVCFAEPSRLRIYSFMEEPVDVSLVALLSQKMWYD